MKTVSQEFLNEQMKAVSRGARWKITASHSTGGQRDLTKFLRQETLTRVEWNVENTLTVFGSPDIQFKLDYNQDLWDWLQAYKNIEIEVECGFEFEKISRFGGYIDKDNLRMETNGTIYVRAYSKNTWAKTILIKSYGADAPRYMSVRDVVIRLYAKVFVTDYDVRIAPIDVDGYAWSEFNSYEDLKDLVLNKKPYFVWDDHTIIYWKLTTHPQYQWVATAIKLEFNENYSDFDETWNIEVGTRIVDIIRWDAEHVGVIYGTEKSLKYKGGSSVYIRDDYELTKIRVYKVSDWSVVKDWNYSRSSQFGYEWIPMAKTVRRIEGKDRFIIGWNGKKETSPFWIERCVLELRKASDNGTISPSHTSTNKYIHPQTQCARGYGVATNKAWYCILLNETSAWQHDLYIARYIWDEWAETKISDNANQWEGRLTGFGRYMCNDGGRVVDVTKLNMATGFWTYYPETVYTTWDRTSQKHILCGYDVTTDSIQMRIWENGVHGAIELIDPDEIIPTGRYDEHIGATGFFFDDDEGNHNFIFGMRSEPEEDTFYTHWALFGSKWFPYVDSEATIGMSVRTALDELAKAFCCIHHFPNNDYGIFISRIYLPTDVHDIRDNLVVRNWIIQPQSKLKVIVNDTEYGDGNKSLIISSNLIPDNESVREAVGKLYYDFVDEWDFLLQFTGDFLIQYDPLDIVKIKNSLDENYYEGMIVKSVQEKTPVKFTLRGKKL